MIFQLFDNSPQEKIFASLTDIAIKQTNQLVPSIAALQTKSYEYPQRCVEIETHTYVRNCNYPHGALHYTYVYK